MNKTALLETLHDWINKRPGLDLRDYVRDWTDWEGLKTYRAEARSITRDLHAARAMLAYIERRDSITAADILAASRDSFSGRLTIKPEGEGFSIDYCTGQYWPTEYRRAVCAVLSSAIWDWLRDNMPPADGTVTVDIGGKPLEVASHRGQTPGDYLRAAARRELGRSLASRWFR